MIVKCLKPGDEIIAKNAIISLKSYLYSDAKNKLTTDYLKIFLQESRNYFIVALIENEPVGFILAYRLMRIDREQDMMFFYEIEVNVNHRRKGIGRELIKYLKNICKNENIMKMWVETNKSNIAAMNLYKSTAHPVLVGDTAGRRNTAASPGNFSLGTRVQELS